MNREATAASRPLVLVVEDEDDIREILRYNLQREGFRVREATSGEQALVLARRISPDLILLDLMLPGIQGLEVCRRLRGSDAHRDTPLIMVTAKGEEADVVAGLEMGADDYIAKPFSTRELLARVHSVLRRRDRGARSPTLRVGALQIDVAAHEARVDDAPLALTLAEFRLLRALAESPGRVFTRPQLVRRITGGAYEIAERNVDVHVRAIRRKLGEHRDLLRTVRGVGYKAEAS